MSTLEARRVKRAAAEAAKVEQQREALREAHREALAPFRDDQPAHLALVIHKRAQIEALMQSPKWAAMGARAHRDFLEIRADIVELQDKLALWFSRVSETIAEVDKARHGEQS